jgi:hypothetical protein
VNPNKPDSHAHLSRTLIYETVRVVLAGGATITGRCTALTSYGLLLDDRRFLPWHMVVEVTL